MILELTKKKSEMSIKCKRCCQIQPMKFFWDGHAKRVLCLECRMYNKLYLKKQRKENDKVLEKRH